MPMSDEYRFSYVSFTFDESQPDILIKFILTKIRINKNIRINFIRISG